MWHCREMKLELFWGFKTAVSRKDTDGVPGMAVVIKLLTLNATCEQTDAII
jgi:hypothetical protein